MNKIMTKIFKKTFLLTFILIILFGLFSPAMAYIGGPTWLRTNDTWIDGDFDNPIWSITPTYIHEAFGYALYTIKTPFGGYYTNVKINIGEIKKYTSNSKVFTVETVDIATDPPTNATFARVRTTYLDRPTINLTKTTYELSDYQTDGIIHLGGSLGNLDPVHEYCLRYDDAKHVHSSIGDYFYTGSGKTSASLAGGHIHSSDLTFLPGADETYVTIYADVVESNCESIRAPDVRSAVITIKKTQPLVATTTTLSINPPETTYQTPVELVASLVREPDGITLGNEDIKFIAYFAGFTDEFIVETDQYGVARMDYTPNNLMTAGNSYFIEAAYMGSGPDMPSGDVKELSIVGIPTTLTTFDKTAYYSSAFSESEPVYLEAELIRADSEIAINEPIEFFVDGQSKGTASTGINKANFLYAPAGLGVFDISAEYAGSNSLAPSSSNTSFLEVTEAPEGVLLNVTAGNSAQWNEWDFYGTVECLSLDTDNKKATVNITTPWGVAFDNVNMDVYDSGKSNSFLVNNPSNKGDMYAVALNAVNPAGISWTNEETLRMGTELLLEGSYRIWITDLNDAGNLVALDLKDGSGETIKSDIFAEGEFLGKDYSTDPPGSPTHFALPPDCGFVSIEVTHIFAGMETSSVWVKLGAEIGSDNAYLSLVHIYQGGFWSATEDGAHPIAGSNDGDTVYMYVKTDGVPEGTVATFDVYPVNFDEIAVERYEDALEPPATALVQADGTAVASWTAEYKEDGWGGLNDPPEYVFRVHAGDFTAESDELKVPKVTQTFIDKAMWSQTADGSIPITTANDDDTVYMYVEARYGNAGDQVVFNIEEKDDWPSKNDSITEKTYTIQATDITGDVAVFSVPWQVAWQDDEALGVHNPPEFIFKVTINNVSDESGTLEVPSGRAQTFIEVYKKTGVSGQTMTLDCRLYKPFGPIKNGLNGKTIHWYIDTNQDGDYSDPGEDLGTSTTKLGLHGEGTATMDIVPSNLGLVTGNYYVKCTFGGDTNHKASEDADYITVNTDYAAQIIDISQNTFVQGEETPVIITVKNLGNTTDLKIDATSIPTGWGVNDGTIDLDVNKITIKDVPQGAEVAFTFYVTAPSYYSYPKSGNITWKLYKNNSLPLPDLLLDTVVQDVDSFSEIPAPTLISPADGSTVVKPVTLDWAHEWEDKPPTDPQYIEGYGVYLYMQTPDHWEASTYGEGLTGWDDVESYSGARSIKSYNPTASDSDLVQWIFDEPIDITPNTQYTLSVWVKTSTDYTGGASFGLSFYKNLYSEKISGADVALSIDSVDTDWTEYAVTFTSPADAYYIDDLLFDFRNGQGYVWFDDLQIVLGASVIQRNPETRLTDWPEKESVVRDVTFAWDGDDLDGTVINFSYTLMGPEGSGYDGSWTEVPAAVTDVSYAGLPDGNYHFLVKAKDDDLNYDPSPASFSFRIGYNTNPNLIPNPGFETGAADPLPWILTSSGNSDGLWESETAYSGSRSVRLRLIDDPVDWTITQDIPVSPALTYRLSAQVMKAAGAEGVFMVRLNFEDSSGSPAGAVTMPIPDGDSDWMSVTKAFILPDGVDHISSISLRTDEGSGLIWFDDLSLVQISDSEVILPPVTSIESGPEDWDVIDYADVTFQWSGFDSDGDIQGYLYSLDKAINDRDWFPITTGTDAAFADLSPGRHTFYVAAVDNAGFTDINPASRTFIVNKGPETTIISGASGTVSTPTVTFSWTGDDPDGGFLTYSYKLAGSPADDIWSDWNSGTTKTYTDLSGEYTFYVRARDEHGTEDTTPATRSFDVNSSAPVIVAFPPPSVSLDENTSVDFSILATDPDGDILIYQWFLDGELQSQNSMWTFTPGYDQSGEHVITVVVSDGRLSTRQTVIVTVNDVDVAPGITSYDPVADPTINAGDAVIFSVSAEDAAGDFLTYDWKLDGVSVWSGSSWRYGPTTNADAGVHTVQVTVSDPAGLTATHSWTVRVILGNAPPVLDPIGDKTVEVDSTLVFTVTASDANYSGDFSGDGIVDAWDATYLSSHLTGTSGYETIYSGDISGDGIVDAWDATYLSRYLAGEPGYEHLNPPLSYSANNLPPGASFDSSTRTFSWTPTCDQEETYPNVHFEVSDGLLSDSEDITITAVVVCDSSMFDDFTAPDGPNVDEHNWYGNLNWPGSSFARGGHIYDNQLVIGAIDPPAESALASNATFKPGFCSLLILEYDLSTDPGNRYMTHGLVSNELDILFEGYFARSYSYLVTPTYRLEGQAPIAGPEIDELPVFSHHYKIIWTGTIAEWYVDDNLVYTAMLSADAPMRVFFSNSGPNLGPSKMIVDNVDLYCGMTFNNIVPRDTSVVINDGDKYTTDTTVTLTLSAEDPDSDVTAMSLTNDHTRLDSWSPWEPYVPTRTWTLSDGSGEKTVYVKYKNSLDLESPAYSDTITKLEMVTENDLDSIFPDGWQRTAPDNIPQALADYLPFMSDGFYFGEYDRCFEVSGNTIVNEIVSVIISGRITFEYDTYIHNYKLMGLAWTGLEDGISTDIKARVRVASTTEELSDATWSPYYGDNVTTSLFLFSDIEIGRYLQLEVVLETLDDTQTPVLHDVKAGGVAVFNLLSYCNGDFDLDLDVDGLDLAVFATDYGRSDCTDTGDCLSDFDGDGFVDDSDLALLLPHYGRTDCPYSPPGPQPQ